MVNTIYKKLIVFTLILALIISGCINILAVDADNSKDELGFLILSSDLKDGDGFTGNYKYISANELDAIKTNKNPQLYGLGDCWVAPKMYSSFENHGEPAYKYHLVEGLNFQKMMDEVVSGGAAAIDKYFVFSSDNYSSSVNNSNANNLKYFAPGDKIGTVGAFAMLALYKSDSPAYSTKSAIPGTGSMPATAAPVDRGHYVLIMGQDYYDDQNHCKFVHETNTIQLISSTSSFDNTIKTGHNSKILSLNNLMNMGIYRKNNVEGVPLSSVMDSLGLAKYMASYSSNKVSVESKDGKITTVPYDKYTESYVAWNFLNGKSVPKEQNSQFALYTVGAGGNDAVICNIKSINVVDEKGNKVTIVPEKPVTEQPKTETTKKVTKPAKSKIIKISKKGKKNVTVKYKTVNGATGYQIVYGTNKKMTKGKKTITIKKGNIKTKTIKKLKKGKKYYFKVRAYKTVNGKKVYGAYSTVKTYKI